MMIAQDAPPSHYESMVTIDPYEAIAIKQQSLLAMDQLEGWCSKEKASLLMDLIFKNRPETIVEIGVFGGKSLIPMAFALKGNKKGKIYGIDPWSNQASIEYVQNEVNRHWWGTLNLEGIRLGLVSQIERFQLGSYVELIQKTSADTPPIAGIDMLHIDGNHSDPTSYFDVIKWVPLVKSGGWIIFDDMTWYENGVYTTARAVSWLDEHCTKFGEFKDGCVWGIWVKP